MLKQEQVKTPELDKILTVHKDSQKIGGFLEWLGSEGIVLAQWTGLECDECGGGLELITKTTSQMLAQYYEIDEDKAEKERIALLDAVREDNS